VPESLRATADDEPAVLAMLDIALRSHGFAVRRAAGGEAAVRLYREHRGTVDVVLLDVRMPGLDGPHTLAVLQEIVPGVRCVFMSGDTGQFATEQLLALGVSHVLAKPFRGLDEVVYAIREAARSGSGPYGS
jgi:CheY-like chemotaxis protein